MPVAEQQQQLEPDQALEVLDGALRGRGRRRRGLRYRWAEQPDRDASPSGGAGQPRGSCDGGRNELAARRRERLAAHSAPVTNADGTGTCPCTSLSIVTCWESTVRIEETAARTGPADSIGIERR